MTTQLADTAAGATAMPARERARHELAALLDTEPAALDDRASLRDGLTLDSLTMMRVITWLEAHALPITSEDMLPATVGEVLSRVAGRAGQPPQVRLGGVPGVPEPFRARPPDRWRPCCAPTRCGWRRSSRKTSASSTRSRSCPRPATAGDTGVRSRRSSGSRRS